MVQEEGILRAPGCVAQNEATDESGGVGSDAAGVRKLTGDAHTHFDL